MWPKSPECAQDLCRCYYCSTGGTTATDYTRQDSSNSDYIRDAAPSPDVASLSPCTDYGPMSLLPPSLPSPAIPTPPLSASPSLMYGELLLQGNQGVMHPPGTPQPLMTMTSQEEPLNLVSLHKNSSHYLQCYRNNFYTFPFLDTDKHHILLHKKCVP